MTGYERTEGYSLQDLEANTAEAAEYAKRAAARAAKRAAAKAQKRADDLLILLGAVAIAFVVLGSLGFALAKARGFNGGIGSEVLVFGAVVYGIFWLWKKIKPHLN